MNETFYVKGFILKRNPFRERDSKIILITETKGLLELVARGTISIKSKLAGHIEPVTFAELMVIKGKNYDYVGSLRVLDAFQNIKSDFYNIYWTQKSIALLLNSTYKEQIDEALFFLLANYLNFLDSNPHDSEFLYNAFLLKMLSILGYHPEMYYSVESGKPIVPDKIFFDYSKGGITNKQTSTSLTISLDCLKVIRTILSVDFSTINVIKISNKTKKMVINAISFFNQFNNI